MKRRDLNLLMASILATPAGLYLGGLLPSSDRRDAKMALGQIPNFDMKLSRLIQGTGGMSDSDKWFSVLDRAYANGCNSFDSARQYSDGGSEVLLGRWMKQRKNRKDVIVISKGGHPTNADTSRLDHASLENDLNTSLKALGTHEIDLYLLHRDHHNIPVSSVIESLNQFKKQGKIRAFGCSNWTTERIEDAQNFAKSQGLEGFAVSSPQWSLAEWTKEPWNGCVSISGESEAHQRDWYAKTRLPVLAWSSLSGGMWGNINKLRSSDFAQEIYGGSLNAEKFDRAAKLAVKYDVSVQQIALAYLFNSQINLFAIMGTVNETHFIENRNALKIKLDSTDMEFLNAKKVS